VNSLTLRLEWLLRLILGEEGSLFGNPKRVW